MKRKLISVILAVIFCLSLLSPDVFAKNTAPLFDSAERLKMPCPLKEKCINTMNISSAQYEEMVDGLYEAAINFKESYELRPFRLDITEENLYCIGEIVGEFYEAFYLTGSFRYTSIEGEDFLNSVIFEYVYDRSTAAGMKKEIEEKVSPFIGDLVDSDIPDYEKALLVHDRIVVRCEYDEYNVDNNPENIPQNDFSVYGVLVNGIAVCEGYSRTYTYLLSCLGIRSYNCLSYDLGHMWNIVYIDGKEYHTDTTFDDPILDVTGKVSHAYLLISTEKMISLRGEADYYHSPSSDKYDNFFWNNSMTECCFIGGTVYCFDTEENKIQKFTEGGTALVYKPEDVRWKADATTVWKGNHSKMSSDGKYLYYTTPEEIMKLDVNTGKAEVCYHPSVSGHSEFLIYGFTVDGEYFVIDMFNSPNFLNDTKELYEYRHKFVRERKVGDINGDGKINVSDASLLKSVIVGKVTDPELRKLSDINGDGKVNVSDTLLLKKIITGKVVT